MSEKRDKASDVFNKTNYVLGEKKPFAEAFPQIEKLTVDVEETDGFSTVSDCSYGNSTAGEYIDCSNSSCYKGGFRLGAIIREMIDKKSSETETTEFCRGYEGSPKGRRKYGPCDHQFNVKVKILYKAS